MGVQKATKKGRVTIKLNVRVAIGLGYGDDKDKESTSHLINHPIYLSLFHLLRKARKKGKVTMEWAV